VTPDELLRRLQQKNLSPAYLLLGSETYMRERVRRALIETALPAEDRETGYTRVDLQQVPLAAALDDARSLSLFAANRLIWLESAEAALPRGRAVTSDESEDGESNPKGDAALLAEYVRDPPPQVVLVVDAGRYELEGEDRAKAERVRTFYSAIANAVEFRPFSVEAARHLAQQLAKQNGLQIGLAELGLLVEATGADASRIANELEKLSLYGGASRKITAEDIVHLVPDAQATTIFALVAALGRDDRSRALEILHTLVREGEYLALALTFLATQFRLALAASDANLRSAQAVQSYFTKIGVRMWRDRAEQVYQTVSAFPKAKLERALEKIFIADRGLRDARPDDRIVMEDLILNW
jgi:DNA polymerase-3 subunit delta